MVPQTTQSDTVALTGIAAVSSTDLDHIRTTAIQVADLMVAP